MKQYKLLITFLLLMACNANIILAQRTYEPKFYVGGHAGVTLSRINFSPAVAQSFLIGKQAGLSVRYAEESHVGLLGEINFVQRGWNETFEGLPLKYSRTINYINIPIMTHIFLGSKRFKVFFNLGPEVSFMVGESTSCDFDINDTGNIIGFPNTHRTEQYKLDIKSKFDYGISAGTGVELILANRHSILLDGRFYYGLGNIFPSHKTDYFSASPNMSIMVSLGYMIRLK